MRCHPISFDGCGAAARRGPPPASPSPFLPDSRVRGVGGVFNLGEVNTVNASGGKLLVKVWNLTGAAVQARFMFVTCKPG